MYLLSCTYITHKVIIVISGGLYGCSKQAGSWGVKMDHNSEVFHTLFYSFEEKTFWKWQAAFTWYWPLIFYSKYTNIQKYTKNSQIRDLFLTCKKSGHRVEGRVIGWLWSSDDCVVSLWHGMTTHASRVSHSSTHWSLQQVGGGTLEQ